MPVTQADVDAARAFLQSSGGQSIAIACDSDVDGLTSAVLAERAAAALGARPVVLPVRRGEHAHRDSMRQRIANSGAARLIVLDMGSRPEPILPGVSTLLIDHHAASAGFPPGAIVVNGFDDSPVPTTSVLTFAVTRFIDGMARHAWLAALGAVADLGSAADFAERLGARVPVTAARTAASLLNAARRAAEPDPELALDVLRRAASVQDIVNGRVPGVDRLRAMQRAVRAEIDRCSKVPPRVSGDVALIRFSSGVQAHPVVAIRWARRLHPRIVIAANDGYLPGRTNFAVRCSGNVDLIVWLRSVPFTPPAGSEYANGHPKATGGSLATDDFSGWANVLGFG
jgi:hypothetical protein